MKKKNMLMNLTSFADDEEILKLISVAKLWKNGERIFLEWEGDTLDGSCEKTYLSVKGSRQVMIAYSDPGSPVLVLEDGKKCFSVQPSPLPFLPSDSVGYATNYIRNTLTPAGGRLTFEYVADYRMNKYRRKVDIRISEYRQ